MHHVACAKITNRASVQDIFTRRLQSIVDDIHVA